LKWKLILRKEGIALYDYCLKFNFENWHRSRSSSSGQEFVALLDNTVRKRRYEEESLIGSSFVKRSMCEDTKALLSAKKSKNIKDSLMSEVGAVVVVSPGLPPKHTIDRKLQTPSQRQSTIPFLYESWGSPNWKEITGKKLATKIQKTMGSDIL
jgi:hypothetical protein